MINLSKNQTINLSKQSSNLSQVRFGINWGMKEVVGKKREGGLFGFGGKVVETVVGKQAVDLDASATVFSGANEDTVYFGKLRNSFITHSGDDLVGDDEKDDDDNETITIDLSNVPNHVQEVYLYVNSFSGQKFNEIPYAGIRIYEGNVNNPTKVLAKFDLVNDSSFKDAKTIILGKLYKENGDWDFKAIGDTYNVSRIEPTIAIIKQKYR